MNKQAAELFDEIYEEVFSNHKLYSEKALAFYQGVMWSLANIDPKLQSDYYHICELLDLE